MRRAGFTLIELMVAMATIAVTLTIGSMALSSALSKEDSGGDTRRVRLEAARRQAIDDGDHVVVSSGEDSAATSILFLPDGRAVGGGVDALTGTWSGS